MKLAIGSDHGGFLLKKRNYESIKRLSMGRLWNL